MAKKQYVAPEMEIVEVDANDGNRYSLPYGIAKGLGLDTTGMRPREVWEMLKGRGITPENEYDKLKEKAEKEVPKEDPKQVAKRDTQIKTIMTSQAFSKLPDVTRGNIEGALKKLSEDDFAAFERFHTQVGKFQEGDGSYDKVGRVIEFERTRKGGALDSELGYDFQACTFFHEYGHFVDNILSIKDGGSWLKMSSGDVNVSDDALFAFNELMKESGIQVKPLTSFDRITRDQKAAFYSGLAKITGKNKQMEPKLLSEFGYVQQPSKPTWTVEQSVMYFGERNRSTQEKLWKTYEENLKKWQMAEADGTNQRAKDARDAYEQKMREHNKPIKATLERYGIISDFFGLYTNDRISPHKNGYWGHKGSYNKTKGAQGECWAEYYSFKMTNDTKGLDIMKKFLPKTFDAFEKKFNSIKNY